ncbi:hypothetical protein CHCC20441_3517 [Bacillus licheniformis]|uniref:Uncharacterized protein n=1 Tax=Bacillus licheniformis TaxID=1402 RepID=A0A5Q3BNQ6_BACLI|nr:hypothetical protein [Bacillus licheniformis]MBJ7887286.1 hypothetical protein [Bacillaceae bacterium HSR45]MBY8346402.1 hypothetical protein [Bacillus sp. PCH94]NBB42701.1 hypothetical protein [Bacillus sp. y1(2019)]TWN17026.1 hypothetical protein CHCC14564_1591 [Bacillus licheniformis LMG 17339]KAA0812525.1 hypothetical protein EI978_05000 [Bacillus licheniformis]
MTRKKENLYIREKRERLDARLLREPLPSRRQLMLLEGKEHRLLFQRAKKAADFLSAAFQCIVDV